MQRSILLVSAVFMVWAANLEAQGLLDTIITPDKAVPTVNQTLEGTWMAELRPPGLPPAAPSIPNLSTFGADGTLIASGSDGNQSSAHGIWLRVGDRKFPGNGIRIRFRREPGSGDHHEDSCQYPTKPGRADLQGDQ